MKKLLFILTLFITSNLFAQVNTGNKIYTKVGGGGSTDTTSLSDRIDTNAAHITLLAPINNPVFTGVQKVSTTDTLATKAYARSVGGGGGGSGTVTSVGTGYGLTGGPITTSGTVTFDSATVANYFLRRKDSTISFTTPYQSSLKADDNSVVHLTGTETISGTKRFNGGLGVGMDPVSPLTVKATAIGSNNGISLNLLANNVILPSQSYESIDFSVPTSGVIGQFFATASNYNAGISLQPNSMGLDAISNQLWLAAINSSGYISLVTGGAGVNNERLRILGSGNFIFQNGGTYTDIPSAKVQFNSTTQGILSPRMTSAQFSSISSKSEGLHAYDLTNHKPTWYDGSAIKLPLWTTDSLPVAQLQGTIPLSKITPSNTVLQRGLGHRGGSGNDTLFNFAHVATYTSASSININADTTDAVVVTALATGLTLNTPTGIAYYDNQPLTIRIRDSGTSQTLTFGSGFSFSSSLAAPTGTTAGKLLYMKFIYDAPDNVWLCVQKLDNFN